MAFANRTSLISPGFGTPISNDALFLLAGTAISGASQQTTSLAGLTPAIRTGYIRVRVYNGGGANTTVAVIVQVTDGTGTMIVFSAPATAVPNVATSGVDYLIPFITELAVTQLSVLTTLAGTTTTASMDIEMSASN
jgi:hypothetical protein